MENLKTVEKNVVSAVVAKQSVVKVPPINLININTVNYLFSVYPFLINTGSMYGKTES